MAIERALISAYDKTGLAEFGRELAALGIEIVSTGGTAQLLRKSGVKVRDVVDLTGWPEMLGGRVKTLHPKVHGGILFRRENAGDRKQAAEHGIAPIDLVVVNLYPFEAVASEPGVKVEELIENIDIGGPAMVRSAAKNFASVAVVTDPMDYGWVIEAIKKDGAIPLESRMLLAEKAFALTARYDGQIAMELERVKCRVEDIELGGLMLEARPPLPRRFFLALSQKQFLRYGENPHQAAALYTPAGQRDAGLAGAKQLQGKELSYNNLVDLDAAWALAEEFSKPAAAIIKHSNPCGAAEQETLAEAYRKAYACDPVSAYGSVLAFNRALDAATADEVSKLFVECIVAPGYEAAALERLSAKKNLRLLEIAREQRAGSAPDYTHLTLKRIAGGFLAQQQDHGSLDRANLKVVTDRAPGLDELDTLLFAWKVCKHVKSNAIVFAREGRTLGVGAGQMSRVDSVKIAAMKAQAAGLSLAGAAVASDAFFPFPDGVEEAAKAGATSVIQPGGSVRDAEVIAAANRLGLAMVFTGIRHFRH